MMMIIPTYVKSKGYGAGGAARYGHVAGIDGEPYLKEVKKNSKSERCMKCGETIAVNVGMNGWVAALMIQKSTCSHVVKNETLWYHASCCPASDPRMEGELVRRAKEERKRQREEDAPAREAAKKAKEAAKKAKIDKEIPADILALDERALTMRMCTGGEPNIKYLQEHCVKLGVKKSGNKREVMMRLVVSMEARGISMKCDMSNYSSTAPYGYRGTLYGPSGDTL